MSEAFLRQGAREVDELLAHTGVAVHTGDRLLEIGCEAGRMTGWLAELAGSVVALDVSPEVLRLAREYPPGRSTSGRGAAATCGWC